MSYNKLKNCRCYDSIVNTVNDLYSLLNEYINSTDWDENIKQEFINNLNNLRFSDMEFNGKLSFNNNVNYKFKKEYDIMTIKITSILRDDMHDSTTINITYTPYQTERKSGLSYSDNRNHSRTVRIAIDSDNNIKVKS